MVESHGATDGVVLLRVTGEIDMETVADLSSALQDAVADGDVTGIVVDFAGVTFCDSSGIRALDQAYVAASRRGIGFRVVDLRPPVRRIFEIVGVLEALTAPSTGPNGADHRNGSTAQEERP
jgi:anti-anti-sigma factor